MTRERITIFDTTLRDGEQSPGCSMNVAEKQRLARQLDRLGVDVIEAGFPVASDGDFAAVQAISAEIRRPIICGLARAVPQDIERGLGRFERCGSSAHSRFLTTSDIHLQYKLEDDAREVPGAGADCHPAGEVVVCGHRVLSRGRYAHGHQFSLRSVECGS